MSEQTPMSGKSRRRGRTPGLVFTALAAVLVALVAAAFTPSQPPPPPTAEFAPEAAKPIKVPPPNQTSNVGNPSNTGNHGGTQGLKVRRVVPPPPSQSGPVINTKSVKNCVGSPPRQIEDPESPPCIAYWNDPKGNGGTTTRGVDANTIRIAMPNASREIQAMVNFFNLRFQFYGRKLVLVNAGGCFAAESPSELKDSADSIAEHSIFASLGYCDMKGMEYPLYDELARDGVVSVANRPGVETEAHMAQFHPYEWTFWPTFDEGQAEAGDIACSLNGQPARFAGGSQFNQPRKFGVIYNSYQDGPQPDISAVKATLKACGISAVTAQILVERDGGPAAGQGYSQNTAQQVTNAIVTMQNDHVTTLIDLTHTDTTKQVFQVASSQGFEPEHIVTSYLYNDADEFISDMPPDQQGHVIGLSTWNKHIHPVNEYWFQAVEEGHPGYQWTSASGDSSQEKAAKYEYYGAWYDYYELLTLAAGIQMAGPHLNPMSFARGLQQTTYPNPFIPGHEEGIVSIHPGQHSYIADATVMYFNASIANSDYGTPGSFCYVENGRRFAMHHIFQNLSGMLFNGVCQRYESD
jgi:hypothetical protein